jgi:hypothetical protein
LRKFLTNFTQPLIDELSKVLLNLEDVLDSDILGLILQVIYKDFQNLSDLLSKGIKNLNLLDFAKRITEDVLKRQLDIQVLNL